MKPPRTHTLGGKKFRLALDVTVDGYCEVGKKRKQPELYVNGALPPKQFLNRLLHEAAHGVCPRMQEKTICRLADELTGLLWRLGYRREHDE